MQPGFRSNAVFFLAYLLLGPSSHAMAYFSLAAVSVHVRAASMCRRAVNVTLACGATQFLARAQPLPGAALHMAVHHKAFSGAVPANGKPNMVLVKVGTGEYRRLSLDGEVLNMDSTAILKALKADDIFANKLKDAPLDDCKVWVLPAFTGKVPTPDDEKSAKLLEGDAEVASIPVEAQAVMDATTVSKVVLRVMLPPTIRHGELLLHFILAAASHDFLEM
jgi:hypothetical protein